MADVTRPAGRIAGVVVLMTGLTMAWAAPVAAATGSSYPRISKVKVNDDKVKPGETVTVSVKAKNSTTVASRGMDLTFILSSTASPVGGTALRTGSVAAIPAGDSDKEKFKVTVPSPLAAGDYQLLVCQSLDGPTQTVLGKASLKVKATSGTTGGSPVTPTPPGSGAGAPARVLNLTNWKLTLPVGKSAHKATEVKQPALNGFVDPTYFHVDGSGTGVVFRADAGGATTSGSTYPRSELREMDGSDEADWTSSKGVHTMTITEAITHLPVKKPHVVAGQIHDAEDDVVMVRLEGKRLFVESDGDEVGLLDANYALGAVFTVTLTASTDGIQVTYLRTPTSAPVFVRVARTGSGYYFKAGCYTQSNVDKGDAPDAYGEVVIHSLSVQHS